MQDDGPGLREDAAAKTSGAQPSEARPSPSDAGHATDGDTARPPEGRAGIVFWGLVMFTGCRLIEIFLEAQSMAAAVGQAVLVEWGSSRLGVVWSPPSTENGGAMTTAIIARRVALGAAVGLGAAAALFGVLAMSRGAAIEGVASVEASVLVIGIATAALTAWRDELLLHGVMLRALEAGSGNAKAEARAPVSGIVKVLACGITSAGAALGQSDATSRTVFSAALLGILYGALWVRDRGAWQPWAAHAGFRFATGTLLSGGIVHARLANDAWAGGSAGILGGTAATIALVPVAVVALVWTARRISPPSAPIG